MRFQRPEKIASPSGQVNRQLQVIGSSDRIQPKRLVGARLVQRVTQAVARDEWEERWRSNETSVKK